MVKGFLKQSVDKTGWDESSQIDLLTRFIEELNGGEFIHDFAMFLEAQVKVEQEMSSEE